jgi:hypothetical protein
MNNVRRQTYRTVRGAAGPFVWIIAADPLLRLRIERNSLDPAPQTFRPGEMVLSAPATSAHTLLIEQHLADG